MHWTKARKSHLDSDWLNFRQLLNRCTVEIERKSQGWLSPVWNDLNNSSTLWSTNKSFDGKLNRTELLSCIVKDSCNVFKRSETLNCFNKLLNAPGSLFDSLGHPSKEITTAALGIVRAILLLLNQKHISTSAGQKYLDPCLLKLTTAFIALLVTHLLNFSSLASRLFPNYWLWLKWHNFWRASSWRSFSTQIIFYQSINQVLEKGTVHRQQPLSN